MNKVTTFVPIEVRHHIMYHLTNLQAVVTHPSMPLYIIFGASASIILIGIGLAYLAYKKNNKQENKELPIATQDILPTESETKYAQLA